MLWQRESFAPVGSTWIEWHAVFSGLGVSIDGHIILVCLNNSFTSQWLIVLGCLRLAVNCSELSCGSYNIVNIRHRVVVIHFFWHDVPLKLYRGRGQCFGRIGHYKAIVFSWRIIFLLFKFYFLASVIEHAYIYSDFWLHYNRFLLAGQDIGNIIKAFALDFLSRHLLLIFEGLQIYCHLLIH